jgi:uncharacterized protein YuzE
MKESYLEITYRHGRPIAAYLYLPRASRDRSRRSAKAARGLVIDFTQRGKPIGIEITAPSKVTVTAVNRILKELGFPLIRQADLAPLRAA